MAKSKKQRAIENELSALGYDLVRQYVILDRFGYVVESFPTLDAVDQWIGKEESRHIGIAGGDNE